MSLDTKLIKVIENEREIKDAIDTTADAIGLKLQGNPNLYDIKTYPITPSKYIYGADGTVLVPSQPIGCTLDYMPCSHLQGKTLTLNHCRGNTPGVAFYDNDKNFISGVEYRLGSGDAGITAPITFDVPTDALYFRFSIDIQYIDEIKLEEGTESTLYVPYGEWAKYNIKDFPQKVEEVYNKGAKDEYDVFWDEKQQYGGLTFYSYAFAGYGWTDKNYKPKYPIVTNNSPNRSNAMFNYSSITKIMTPLYFYDTTSNSTFAGCSSLIKIGDDTGGGIWQTRNRTDSANFSSCSKLEEIRYIDYNEKGEYVPSEIGKSHSFISCKVLSVASMINIIKHLADYSTDETNKGKCTLTFHADAWTRLSEAEQQGRTPQSEGINFTGTWRNYVSSLGWNT